MKTLDDSVHDYHQCAETLTQQPSGAGGTQSLSASGDLPDRHLLSHGPDEGAAGTAPKCTLMLVAMV